MRENVVCDVCGRRTTRKIIKGQSPFHVCLTELREVHLTWLMNESNGSSQHL